PASGAATSSSSMPSARRRSHSCSGTFSNSFSFTREDVMLLFKYVLMAGSAGLFSAAVGVLVVDVVTAVRASQMLMLGWPLAGRLALLACVPLLPALSIVVVPSGTGAVRVSQLSGTLPGTLYPGTHVVMPLVHRVELFNI